MEAKGRVWPWPWLLGADLAGEARGALRTVGLVLAEARRAALAVGGGLGENTAGNEGGEQEVDDDPHARHEVDWRSSNLTRNRLEAQSGASQVHARCRLIVS